MPDSFSYPRELPTVPAMLDEPRYTDDIFEYIGNTWDRALPKFLSTKERVAALQYA